MAELPVEKLLVCLIIHTCPLVVNAESGKLDNETLFVFELKIGQTAQIFSISDK